MSWGRGSTHGVEMLNISHAMGNEQMSYNAPVHGGDADVREGDVGDVDVEVHRDDGNFQPQNLENQESENPEALDENLELGLGNETSEEVALQRRREARLARFAQDANGNQVGTWGDMLARIQQFNPVDPVDEHLPMPNLVSASGAAVEAQSSSSSEKHL